MHRLNAALCSMRTEMQHVHFCFAVSGPTVSSEPWMSRFVSGNGEVVSMATFVPSSCTFSFLHIVCISSLKQFFWHVCYVLCLWRRFDSWWEETERGWKKASRETGRRRRDRKQTCSTAHFSVSIFSPFVANVMAQSTHASAGCSWWLVILHSRSLWATELTGTTGTKNVLTLAGNWKQQWQTLTCFKGTHSAFSLFSVLYILYSYSTIVSSHIYLHEKTLKEM